MQQKTEFSINRHFADLHLMTMMTTTRNNLQKTPYFSKAATALGSFCSRNGLHAQSACSRVLADNETESSSLH
jgi:hypothetical protein